MNCPDSLSQTSLQSLLGSIFSGTTRGQAIALRTKFGQAIIPVVTIATGIIITFLPRTDEQRILLYQIFFIASFLLGVVEVVIFNRLNVPQETAAPTKRLSGEVKKMLRDRRFRRFFIPAIAFAFTWQAGWPLVNIYYINRLDASELWFAIFALSSGVAAFLSGTFWQRLLRKRGNSTTFIVSAALLSLNMFIFPLVPNVVIMAIISLPIGVSTIGITTALLNGALEATPDDGRMMYLAYFNTAMNISLFAAPFFAIMLFGFFGIGWAMIIVGGLRSLMTLVLVIDHRMQKARGIS